MKSWTLPLLGASMWAGLSAAAPSPGIRLAWPVACTLGGDCAIQNYVDEDPGPAVRDYAGHARTYPGHDGIDIRLASMTLERRGVNVLAAAGGTVLRVRDGVPDRSIRDAPAGAASGVECGNGVVVDHGGGWGTQYCHMRQGSLAVRPGQQVATGAVLGQVGLSGDTEFPHLHLTVRKDGRAVDPFAFSAGGRTASLWSRTPPYREGEVLVSGFAARPVTMRDIQEQGSGQLPRPGRTSALVAFVQAIGLQAGDVQRLTLTAPGGTAVADSTAPPLDHDKAQQMLFVGKAHAPAGGWPAGPYRAAYRVLRNGRNILSHDFELTL